MERDDRLTVLLTLKGRHDFTVRWMTYAQHVEFPFKILVADGSSDDGAQDLLAKPSRWHGLRVEYVRYAEDKSYDDYHDKVAAALARIDAPFVVMADNDDFFLVETLRCATDFLEAHPEFSLCGGHTGAFWAADAANAHEVTRNGRLESRWIHRPPRLHQARAGDRMLEHARSYCPTFYDVQRTEQLRRRWEVVTALRLKDIFLGEHLLALLGDIDGKVERLEMLHLVQQMNPPQSTAASHMAAYGDYFERMFLDSWSSDFEKFRAAVGAAVALKDGLDVIVGNAVAKKTYMRLIAPLVLDRLRRESPAALGIVFRQGVIQSFVGLSRRNPLRRSLQWIYRRSPWLSISGESFFETPLPGYNAQAQVIHDFLRTSPASQA